ncbi:unnamed protein product [Agarophyton chilense]
MFPDPLHVRKNMRIKLRASRAIGISLYEKALYAPMKAIVYEIVMQFSPEQKLYLQRYEKPQFYKAYSSLEDSIITSQGAKNHMGSSWRNHIRSVEQDGFLNWKASSLACKAPLPLRVEQKTAELILRSRQYQEKIEWINGAMNQEATVISMTKGLRSAEFSLKKATKSGCYSVDIL